MLVPNIDRILVKKIKISQDKQKLILAGEQDAGENLFLGEVIHPGSTRFKKGQRVYYSEYSASAIRDLTAIEKGESTYGSEPIFVVAQDDIMAYEQETENDFVEV